MSHDPVLMRGVVAGLVLTVVLGGCGEDHATAPDPDPEEFPGVSLNTEPERITDVETVELDVTVSYDGVESRSWFDRPQLDLSVPHDETHTWNSADQFWEIQIDNTVPQSPLGSDHPPTVDLATARLTASGVSMTDRSGSSVSFPSQTPSLNPGATTSQIAQDMGLETASLQESVRIGLDASASASSGGSDAAGGPAPHSAAARKQAAVDRLVVTKKGTGRTLKRIRDSGFTERSNPGRLKLFTETRGDAEVRLYFNPQVGAVVRTETYQDGTLSNRKERSYERVKGRPVLQEVTTTFFDAAGEEVDRITRRYDDVRLGQGG